MECTEIYERIENVIYKNKFVVVYNNGIKDFVNENLKKVNSYKFTELLVDDKDKFNYEKCMDKKYGNDNNKRMIFKNSNEYDSNNPIYKIIFPMIFINGMNIGGFNFFNDMIYRREIEKF